MRNSSAMPSARSSCVTRDRAVGSPLSMTSGIAGFAPHPLLRNPHLMTLFPRFWARPGLPSAMPAEARLFTVTPESRILGHCHWQPDPKRHPTLIVIHGLEGCSESHYMLGLAEKAWRRGFNIVRLNQRNCGGSEHLTPTLYNNGMSGDVRAVLGELAARDGLDSIWLGGYSMGGNLVLKAAGELGASSQALKGVVAVCPNIDPAACTAALIQPRNWIYNGHFVRSLKARLRRKASLFPGKYDLSRLPAIRTLLDFDEAYTAPDGGYRDAAEYYERAGSRHVLGAIAVPTLILTAQDDPFIPYWIFDIPAVRTNSRIRFEAPRHGGHCGFIQRASAGEDRYWAEHRVIEFVAEKYLHESAEDAT
ncbi:MAG: alpha/beta fold hydrolase [Nitrospirae bacterium]|nr:MAG: alpha/beta fold hydrolase [Nitrospirota bacterium]